jgi:hypothetical protein
MGPEGGVGRRPPNPPPLSERRLKKLPLPREVDLPFSTEPGLPSNMPMKSLPSMPRDLKHMRATTKSNHHTNTASKEFQVRQRVNKKEKNSVLWRFGGGACVLWHTRS